MKMTIRPTIAVLSAIALTMGATSSLATEVYTFGSDNDGLAGFTQSTPEDETQFWITQAGSVQYTNQNNGTRNSSFLRPFALDRSTGKCYRFQGVVTLTDGYADDNNRVGLYLFGNTPEVPNQDEVGSIGLIFNTDDNAVGGPPGDNTDDDIALRVGIDSTDLSGDVDRNQATTPYAQDLFTTTIMLTADITFLNDGTDDLIQIDASLTDMSGDKTKVSTSVLAAEYTGSYFGFVTRARARFFGVEGDPRSAPWVMDYKSFSVTPLSLSVAPSMATPGNFDFSWFSKEGKLYDLVSSTDLSDPLDTWSVWDERADLAATPPSNALNDISGGGDARRFFAVVEKNPPPLLVESFNAPGPDLPAGWTAVNATTVWDVGDPSGLTNLQDPDGTNCVGTNVVAGNYADEVATVTLTSPPVSIPAGGATLSFRQYIDSDAPNGDVGAVRLLDATDTEIVEGDFPVTPIDGIQIGWTNESFALPPSAAGQSVKVVFEFTTAADGLAYRGFYIDDVVIDQ